MRTIPPWRNQQTRSVESAVPTGLQVQVLSEEPFPAIAEVVQRSFEAREQVRSTRTGGAI